MNGLIPDGQAQITGNFTEAEADSLATSLKFGALPIAFEKDPPVETVGPSLAGDQLSAGITAGIVGLLLVMLYCLLYYRGLGLVVVASLLVAGAADLRLVLLLSEAAGFTLSLPGIAGLIVAVGITADSFIVFFERIRDEMRDGQVDAGRGRGRLDAGAEHLPGGRRRLAARGGRALHLRRRRREGLRVRARPLHRSSTWWCSSGSPSRWCRGWPGTGSSTSGHKLSGLDRETLGIDTARHRGREGLMGKFSRLGNDLYNGRTLDRLRRPQVALVRHLRRHRRCWPSPGSRSRASTAASSSPAARSTASPPAGQVTQDTADELREAVAGTGHRRRRRPDRHHLGQRRDPRPDRAARPTRRATRSSTRSSRRPASTPQDDISQDRDRRQLGQGGRPALAARPRSSSWCSSCSSSGPTSASGRCRSPRSSRWPTTSSSRSASTRSPGFEVTPATVTGVLTILGFSLYDTVVVFDKVRENTKNLRERRTTYAGAGQPRRQPDPGALDQHLDRGADPGRRDPVRRRRPARQRLAEGPRARAVRRHGGRCLLLDLHRDAAAGAAEVERDRGQARREAGRPRGAARSTAYASVPAFTEDMPIARRAHRRPAARHGRRPTPSWPGEPAPAAPRTAGGQPAAAGPRRRRGGRSAPAAPPGRAQPTRQTRSKRGKK